MGFADLDEQSKLLITSRIPTTSRRFPYLAESDAKTGTINMNGQYPPKLEWPPQDNLILHQRKQPSLNVQPNSNHQILLQPLKPQTQKTQVTNHGTTNSWSLIKHKQAEERKRKETVASDEIHLKHIEVRPERFRDSDSNINKWNEKRGTVGIKCKA